MWRRVEAIPGVSSPRALEVPVSRSLNKVILIGNLGADPEVRSTANGNRVANFNLATSRRWTGPGGDQQEKTEWHRIVVWNNGSKGSGLADVVEKYCKKGDKVYVEGRIEYRSWQDREGQTRYTTEIVANDLILLSGRGTQGGAEGGFVPAKAAAGAAGTASPKKEGTKSESFDDFPEALDSEDDDLPF
jgi:single-strand DNA-binding protein